MSQNHTSKTRELDAPERPGVDRRKFLGTVGLAAGAVFAASVAPLAARAAASDSSEGDAAAPLSNDGRVVSEPTEGLWDVDDMWGQRPRYAHPIPYAHGIPGAGPLERSGPYSVLAGEL